MDVNLVWLSYCLHAILQASVEGFCKHLNVSKDEALNLIGHSVAMATEARSWFLEKEKLQVCIY